MPSRLVLALTTLCVLAAAGVFGVWLATRGDDAPAATGWEGAIRPPGARLPDFELANQDGETVTAAALRGRPVVVTFIYSTCEDTCPGQVQSIRGALDDLGHDVPVIGVSVDPANDTPQTAEAFMLEQSMKLAANDYVFQPNDANTWSLVTSMLNNFLTNEWKQGALVGPLAPFAGKIEFVIARQQRFAHGRLDEAQIRALSLRIVDVSHPSLPSRLGGIMSLGVLFRWVSDGRPSTPSLM